MEDPKVQQEKELQKQQKQAEKNAKNLAKAESKYNEQKEKLSEQLKAAENNTMNVVMEADRKIEEADLKDREIGRKHLDLMLEIDDYNQEIKGYNENLDTYKDERIGYYTELNNPTLTQEQQNDLLDKINAVDQKINRTEQNIKFAEADREEAQADLKQVEADSEKAHEAYVDAIHEGDRAREKALDKEAKIHEKLGDAEEEYNKAQEKYDPDYKKSDGSGAEDDTEGKTGDKTPTSSDSGNAEGSGKLGTSTTEYADGMGMVPAGTTAEGLVYNISDDILALAQFKKYDHTQVLEGIQPQYESGLASIKCINFKQDYVVLIRKKLYYAANSASNIDWRGADDHDKYIEEGNYMRTYRVDNFISLNTNITVMGQPGTCSITIKGAERVFCYEHDKAKKNGTPTIAQMVNDSDPMAAAMRLGDSNNALGARGAFGTPGMNGMGIYNTGTNEPLTGSSYTNMLGGVFLPTVIHAVGTENTNYTTQQGRVVGQTSETGVAKLAEGYWNRGNAKTTDTQMSNLEVRPSTNKGYAQFTVTDGTATGSSSSTASTSTSGTGSSSSSITTSGKTGSSLSSGSGTNPEEPFKFELSHDYPDPEMPNVNPNEWKFAEKCDWEEMDEVWVFGRSHFERDGNQGPFKMKQIFFGYIDTVQKQYTAGKSNGPIIVIQATDQLKILGLSYVTHNPTLTPGASMNGQGFDIRYGHFDEHSPGTFTLYDPDAAMKAVGENGSMADATDKQASDAELNANWRVFSLTNVFAGLTVEQIVKRVCADAGVPMWYTDTRIEPIKFPPWVMKHKQYAADMLFQASTETRLRVCQSAAQKLLLEFFADEEGNIVLKCPSYALGVNALVANNMGLQELSGGLLKQVHTTQVNDGYWKPKADTSTVKSRTGEHDVAAETDTGPGEDLELMRQGYNKKMGTDAKSAADAKKGEVKGKDGVYVKPNGTGSPDEQRTQRQRMIDARAHYEAAVVADQGMARYGNVDGGAAKVNRMMRGYSETQEVITSDGKSTADLVYDRMLSSQNGTNVGHGVDQYEIQAGDTLWSIAANPKYWYDGSKWSEIWRDNEKTFTSHKMTKNDSREPLSKFGLVGTVIQINFNHNPSTSELKKNYTRELAKYNKVTGGRKTQQEYDALVRRYYDNTLSELTDALIPEIPQEYITAFTLTSTDKNVYNAYEVNIEGDFGIFDGNTATTKISRVFADLPSFIRLGVRPSPKTFEFPYMGNRENAHLLGYMLCARSMAQRNSATLTMIEDSFVKVGNPVRFFAYDEHPSKPLFNQTEALNKGKASSSMDIMSRTGFNLSDSSALGQLSSQAATMPGQTMINGTVVNSAQLPFTGVSGGIINNGTMTGGMVYNTGGTQRNGVLGNISNMAQAARGYYPQAPVTNPFNPLIAFGSPPYVGSTAHTLNQSIAYGTAVGMDMSAEIAIGTATGMYNPTGMGIGGGINTSTGVVPKTDPSARSGNFTPMSTDATGKPTIPKGTDINLGNSGTEGAGATYNGQRASEMAMTTAAQSIYYVEAIQRNINLADKSTMTLTLSCGRMMGQPSVIDYMLLLYKTFYDEHSGYCPDFTEIAAYKKKYEGKTRSYTVQPRDTALSMGREQYGIDMTPQQRPASAPRTDADKYGADHAVENLAEGGEPHATAKAQGWKWYSGKSEGKIYGVKDDGSSEEYAQFTYYIYDGNDTRFVFECSGKKEVKAEAGDGKDSYREHAAKFFESLESEAKKPAEKVPKTGDPKPTDVEKAKDRQYRVDHFDELSLEEKRALITEIIAENNGDDVAVAQKYEKFYTEGCKDLFPEYQKRFSAGNGTPSTENPNYDENGKAKTPVSKGDAVKVPEWTTLKREMDAQIKGGNPKKNWENLVKYLNEYTGLKKVYDNNPDFKERMDNYFAEIKKTGQIENPNS